jgi:hypothetical protein
MVPLQPLYVPSRVWGSFSANPTNAVIVLNGNLDETGTTSVTGLHGDQTKATAQQPPPQGDFARSYGRMAVRTDFLSAHGQSIVPAQKNLRRTLA